MTVRNSFRLLLIAALTILVASATQALARTGQTSSISLDKKGTSSAVFTSQEATWQIDKHTQFPLNLDGISETGGLLFTIAITRSDTSQIDAALFRNGEVTVLATGLKAKSSFSLTHDAGTLSLSINGRQRYAEGVEDSDSEPPVLNELRLNGVATNALLVTKPTSSYCIQDDNGKGVLSFSASGAYRLTFCNHGGVYTGTGHLSVSSGKNGKSTVSFSINNGSLKVDSLINSAGQGNAIVEIRFPPQSPAPRFLFYDASVAHDSCACKS